MKNNWAVWLNKNVCDRMAWLLAFGFLFYSLKDILGGAICSGWDLVPHYHIFTTAIQSLKNGVIRGYDPLWNAGYSTFSFYGPLCYLFPAIIYFGSFGLLTEVMSFNLFLFSIPFIFLIVFHFTAQTFSPTLGSRHTILFGMFFLCVGKPFGHAGIGIAGLLYNGLVTHFFALIFLMALMACLERSKPAIWRHTIVAGFLWMALVLTHAMTTLSAVVMVGLYLITNPSKYRIILLSGMLGLGLSAWYWIPFLNYGWLSTGEKMLFSEWFIDPLFYLYPRLSFETILSILNKPFPGLFTELPLPALLLLLYGVVGARDGLLHGRPYLPVAFFVSLLILPRGFLFSMFDTPIHYYRFVPAIFIVNALMASHGLGVLWRATQALKPDISKITRTGIAVLLTWAAAVTAFREFDLTRTYQMPAPYGLHASTVNFYYSMRQENYPDYKDAGNILDFFGKLPDRDRVAVEVTQFDMERLGSPHFFTAMLPMAHKTPVIPGLLAESSLTHGFVQSAMSTGSDILVWNHSDLVNNPDFMNQSMDSMVERLRLFSIRYILATSKRFTQNLTQLNATSASGTVSVRPVFTSGRFTVFEINHPYLMAERVDFKPFIFIEAGGMNFQTFAESWYLYPGLFSHPVIYTPVDYFSLPLDEQQKIGGIILGCSPDQVIDAPFLKDWWLTGKPIITLSGTPNEDTVAWAGVWHIPSFPSMPSLTGLEQVFNLLETSPKSRAPVEVKLNGGKLSVLSTTNKDGIGTLIRYSYAPTLTDADHRRMYAVTPCFSFMFNQTTGP